MAIEKPRFSAQEIADMTDDALLHEFTRITGRTTLTCKHCHKKECDLQRFVNSIRARCLKKSSDGLHKDMACPKTCDVQQAKNKDARLRKADARAQAD
jgi:hypothetical protein